MRLLALSALATFVSAPTTVAAPIAPSAVNDDIRSRGATTVVHDLFKSGAWTTVVVQQIDAGSSAWIRLAPALALGTDGTTAEELGQSLVYALPKAPEAVLSVLDLTGRSIPRAADTVCSASFAEGDATDPRKYKAAALQAVERVADPALQLAKRACLDELQAVR